MSLNLWFKFFRKDEKMFDKIVWESEQMDFFMLIFV